MLAANALFQSYSAVPQPAITRQAQAAKAAVSLVMNASSSGTAVLGFTCSFDMNRSKKFPSSPQDCVSRMRSVRTRIRLRR